MGLYLLFTDTHLDDQPDNEYRWLVFDHVHRIMDARQEVAGVFCLGDFVDRKDRFTAQFVNRLLGEVRRVGTRVPFWILRGNHDLPLQGPAFFQFINEMSDSVRYVTRPTAAGDIMLLPFTPDPARDWIGIDFDAFRAAFMHVTVTGAISEGGRSLDGVDRAVLPRGLRLYSGDVHNPQTIRNLTYVGCPHVIRFGDGFEPRMLLVDADTLEVAEEVPIDSPRKLVADVSSPADLLGLEVRPGDRVRVRVSLPPSDVDRWGEIEREIASWARREGVELAGMPEGVVESEVSRGERAGRDEADPEGLLRQFAAEDGISAEMLELGIEIVREAVG